MSTETDKRSAKVFIAIPIEHMDADPAAIAMRKAILGCLPDGVRFSNDRIRQVNLRFLGDAAPDAVDELGERLADIAGQHRPFALNLHRMGMFDRNNTISATVWVGIGGDVAALEALHADVATAAHVLGFPPAESPYQPHITVGRIAGANAEGFAALKTMIGQQDLHSDPFECADIALNMSVWTRSRISDNAFRISHSTIRRMPLGGVQEVGVRRWDN